MKMPTLDDWLHYITVVEHANEKVPVDGRLVPAIDILLRNRDIHPAIDDDPAIPVLVAWMQTELPQYQGREAFNRMVTRIRARTGSTRAEVLGMELAAAARALGLKMPGEDIPLPQEDQERRRVPKEEAEVIVRDYLKAHKARADKAEVSVREIQQETGLKLSSIATTAVWRAYQDRLDTLGLSKRPRRKKAQALPSNANETIGEEDAELQRLIQEQTADDQESAAGRGRRGKVRVRKKV